MTDHSSTIQKAGSHSTDNVDVFRIHCDGATERIRDKVIAEQPVTIMIDRVGSFTVMCTPSDVEALAVGFIFSEGMINGIDEVIETYTKPDLPNVIGIQVQDPARISIGRNLIVASSCGMCGARNVEKMIQTISPCDRTLKVTDRLLIGMILKLRARQRLFDLTGGSHGAAIFNSSGEIISFAEDIGRHNALDKAVGQCLLGRHPTAGCGLAFSGRVSLEIVTKAARAGIELIAAVSAVSSYAVWASKKWNITLCGFVRLDKINVYTKSERIVS